MLGREADNTIIFPPIGAFGAVRERETRNSRYTYHQLETSLKGRAKGTANSVVVLEHIIDSSEERLQ